MTGQYVALYLQAALEAEMGSTDSELLARFSASRDELAFATLVQRHGPMVEVNHTTVNCLRFQSKATIKA